MKRAMRATIVSVSIAIGFLTLPAPSGATVVIGDFCISNDGKNYDHGATNAAGTHKCNNGSWQEIVTLTPRATSAR